MTIKLNNVEVSVEEIRQALKDHPEILEEKTFEEEMIGKKCWIIDTDGGKFQDIWNNNKCMNRILSNNNIYFNEQDCDKQIARNLALGRIMKFIRDNKIKLVKDEDWGNNSSLVKWQIDGWNYDKNKIHTWLNSDINYSEHNFSFYTEEDMQKVIKEMEKDLEILLKR